MQLRRVGRSGLEVSRLTLGTMTWGADTDAFDAEDQLTAFLDAGGTTIDTAPIYGNGNTEALLGTLLAKSGARDDLVLAGKAGFVQRGTGVVKDSSRRSLLAQLDRTLAELGTDHLDLWQIHSPDLTVPFEETLATLEHAVQTGRTRYVGVSNFTGWQIAFCHTWLACRGASLPLVSNQVEYSLVNRDPEDDVTDAASHLGMGLFAWSPLGRGVLTGKYRAGTPGDSRGASSAWEQFVGPYLTPQASGIIEALARASDGLGVPMGHVALAWLFERPGLAAAVIGARTTAQLIENLAADAVVLPPEILEALDDVSRPEQD
ncbi:aldo/keto reductase [Aeromicrobium sp. CF3.5]|uniref:aldo/keto reductase n=1 Tax=Aeromicrobium sp. CF3.5 TaxID=3373078 RepID=UPI003EE4F8FF